MQSAGTGESRAFKLGNAHGSGLAKADSRWVPVSLSSRTGMFTWCGGVCSFCHSAAMRQDFAKTYFKIGKR